MLKWIFKRFSDVYVLSELENMYKEIAQLRTEQATFQLEVIDNLFNSVNKVQKRMQTRLTRELQDNDTNSDIPLKRGGLIRPSQFKMLGKR